MMEGKEVRGTDQSRTICVVRGPLLVNIRGEGRSCALLGAILSCIFPRRARRARSVVGIFPSHTFLDAQYSTRVDPCSM